jgi:mono/diheme cytochrome c family protein
MTRNLIGDFGDLLNNKLIRVVESVMRSFALLVFVGLGAVYVWSSVRSLPQETSVKKGDLSAEDLARAKALFGGKCARCHGPDGLGQTVLGDMLGVPDFTNEKWWKDHNDDDLVKSITNGNERMPAFRKKLTKPEIFLLADYVRHFKTAEH